MGFDPSISYIHIVSDIDQLRSQRSLTLDEDLYLEAIRARVAWSSDKYLNETFRCLRDRSALLIPRPPTSEICRFLEVEDDVHLIRAAETEAESKPNSAPARPFPTTTYA